VHDVVRTTATDMTVLRAAMVTTSAGAAVGAGGMVVGDAPEVMVRVALALLFTPPGWARVASTTSVSAT
jgi:hypothetical protein